MIFLVCLLWKKDQPQRFAKIKRKKLESPKLNKSKTMNKKISSGKFLSPKCSKLQVKKPQQNFEFIPEYLSFLNQAPRKKASFSFPLKIKLNSIKGSIDSSK